MDKYLNNVSKRRNGEEEDEVKKIRTLTAGNGTERERIKEK